MNSKVKTLELAVEFPDLSQNSMANCKFANKKKLSRKVLSKFV